MHADAHLVLHGLTAAELHGAAAAARPAWAAPRTPATPVRVRLGWTLVEFGLKLAVPQRHTGCATA
ncbi:hypothetical protein [Streptomyces showdoensis]|uniref:Uncharacterized protein n=1 Tax=Streptomyces showdoensis TaxID=68268 RepID=A0A2P2GCE6_STREW|nr:hypothetical protein [Streptomyces showdoensis]KKZ69124.1 hypothetical protein VO63_35880 [Streptomyces showdoensis]